LFRRSRRSKHHFFCVFQDFFVPLVVHRLSTLRVLESGAGPSRAASRPRRLKGRGRCRTSMSGFLRTSMRRRYACCDASLSSDDDMVRVCVIILPRTCTGQIPLARPVRSVRPGIVAEIVIPCASTPAAVRLTGSHRAILTKWWGFVRWRNDLDVYWQVVLGKEGIDSPAPGWVETWRSLTASLWRAVQI